VTFLGGQLESERSTARGQSENFRQLVVPASPNGLCLPA
jgi:hypothetical protein